MDDKLATLPAPSFRRSLAGLTVGTVCLVGTAVAVAMLPPVWALVVATLAGAVVMVVAVGLFLVWANAWAEGKSPGWEQAVNDFAETCESVRLPVPPLF